MQKCAKFAATDVLFISNKYSYARLRQTSKFHHHTSLVNKIIRIYISCTLKLQKKKTSLNLEMQNEA